MAAYQRLEISEGGDVTAVRFRDRRIDTILAIEQVGEELYRLVEEGRHNRLVLDFSNVDYLSSALIGKLLSLNVKVEARDGNVKLCGIRPEVSDLFHACKLDRVFPISKDAAVASPASDNQHALYDYASSKGGCEHGRVSGARLACSAGT